MGGRNRRRTGRAAAPRQRALSPLSNHTPIEADVTMVQSRTFSRRLPLPPPRPPSPRGTCPPGDGRWGGEGWNRTSVCPRCARLGNLPEPPPDPPQPHTHTLWAHNRTTSDLRLKTHSDDGGRSCASRRSQATHDAARAVDSRSKRLELHGRRAGRSRCSARPNEPGKPLAHIAPSATNPSTSPKDTSATHPLYEHHHHSTILLLTDASCMAHAPSCFAPDSGFCQKQWRRVKPLLPSNRLQ